MQIFDSLSQNLKFISDSKEDIPIKIYVCGPTVYDAIHIGNARSIVVFDLLFRVLRDLHGADNIIYVRNITDIDDKIISASIKRKITVKDLTEETINIFNKDTQYLNCLLPTHQPKVTENLDVIINLIMILLQKEIAYKTQSGIYFDVSKYPQYTQLSNRIIEKEYSNVRLNKNADKKSSKDFVLWKFNDDEFSFVSPWGIGRPGWHIECSALSHKFLGDDFHIHGGGGDLLFPHHSNERAQSNCIFENNQHAKIWMHNGMITINGDKMSKSLNNTITIQDLRKDKIDGRVIRLFLLSSHYRKPIDYTCDKLSAIQKKLEYIIYTLNKYEDNHIDTKLENKYLKQLQKILLQDLNTGLLLNEIILLCKNLNKKYNSQIYSAIKYISNLLGIVNNIDIISDTSYIDKQISLRIIAKKEKNFKLADKIREELLFINIILEDHKDGTTTWIKKNKKIYNDIKNKNT